MRISPSSAIIHFFDCSLDVEVPRNSTSKDSDWSDPTEGSAFSSGDSSNNNVSVAEAELLDEEELEFCEMDQQGTRKLTPRERPLFNPLTPRSNL